MAAISDERRTRDRRFWRMEWRAFLAYQRLGFWHIYSIIKTYKIDMNLWQDLVTTALVGSDRKSPSLPSEEGELGKMLAKLDASEPERMLLGAAALISLHESAGKMPKQLTEEINSCDLDDLPRCSHKASQYLQRMLSREYTELLPELLAAWEAAGKRVPEESLPALLELGRKNAELQAAILPVLGKRGSWLAAQNPAWNYAIATVDVEATWQLGKQAARAAVLKDLRAENPQRARELLVSTWEKDKADERAAFLATFEINLSGEDEPFLEDTLSDRSEHVRRVAAELLARLPESRLCQRMTERVRPLVHFAENVQFSGRTLKALLSLPQTCDNASRRDGIELKPPAGMGEKAWWLQQILASVPLSYWCREGWTPSQLIGAAIASEWKQVLINGWAKAAKRQRDIEWALYLLSASTLPTENLLQIFSPAQRNALVLGILRDNQNLFSSTHPALLLLRQYQYPWSGQLTRAVLEQMRRHISARSSDLGLLSDFEKFCRYMMPGIIPEITDLLTTAAQGTFWAKPIEKCLAIVQFRHDMLKEL